MKLGIKVGPDNNWKQDIETTHPQMVEVWFNISRKNEYTEMFTYLKTQPIDVGLHFWGALPDGTWTTIAYDKDGIADESERLIKQTIDIADEHQFSYVNIHPGAAARVHIDFINERFTLMSEPIHLDEAIQTFLERLGHLHEYAKNKNMVLTVETVPARVMTGWRGPAGRNEPLNIYELPIIAIRKAAAKGYWVANDFCHTAANIITENPEDVWKTLYDTTRELRDKTRLIHLGFLIPPYNGTDNHDMLDNPLMETSSAIPNKKQMIELLKLFQNRDDVWMLVEPKEDHVKNYFLARKILETASQI